MHAMPPLVQLQCALLWERSACRTYYCCKHEALAADPATPQAIPMCCCYNLRQLTCHHVPRAGINIPAATWAQAADRLPPGKPVNLDGLSIPFAELSAPRTSEQTVPSLANSTGSNSGSGAAAKVRLRVYTLACHKDTLSKAAASGQLLGLLSEAAMQFVEAKYGTKLDMNARQVQVSARFQLADESSLL